VDVRAERRVALGGRTLAFTEQAGLLPVLGLNLKF
jgi:hypothetical protein